jgi:hypothetical protein
MARASFLGVCLLLAACGQNTAVDLTDGASCFPDAARPYLQAVETNATPSRDPGGPYSLYFDGSASMVGYVRGGTLDTRLLPDMVGMLPGLSAIDRTRMSVRRFDRQVRLLDPAGIRAMQGEAGYLCPARTPDCDAQESHLDDALDRIAAESSDTLSVVVSDLWLVNNEVLTSGALKLSAPLNRIFASGRGLAVFGFESPYRGRVNDLPSGRRDVSADRRHLFVVVAGPPARLRAFRTAMERAPSPAVGARFAAGSVQYSLFTIEPPLRAAAGTQAFTLEPKSRLRKSVFLTARQGVKLPQFALDREAEAGPGALWPGVDAVDIEPGAIWQGPVRGTARVFRLRDENCAAKGGDWEAEGTLKGGWSPRAGAAFTLDPQALAAFGEGRFLIVGELDRVSLQVPNPDTAWMRAWSFSAAEEGKAITRPVVPTLNLAETARLLELALLEAAEQKPVRLGGFAVAVKVD